jgi:hypothetical protein
MNDPADLSYKDYWRQASEKEGLVDCVFCFADSPDLRDANCEFNQSGFAKRLLTSILRLYREASGSDEARYTP